MLLVTTGAYEKTAAAFFPVGKLHTSPIPKTFLNLICCKEFISTSRKPFDDASSLLLTNSGDD